MLCSLCLFVLFVGVDEVPLSKSSMLFFILRHFGLGKVKLNQLCRTTTQVSRVVCLTDC